MRHCRLAIAEQLQATVDLPQPDSPTSPNASPAPMVKLTPSTHAQPAVALPVGDREVVDLDDGAAHRSCPSLHGAAEDARQAFGEQVEPDDERGERKARARAR